MKVEIWSEITGLDDLLGLADDIADNDAALCGPDGCAVPAALT